MLWNVLLSAHLLAAAPVVEKAPTVAVLNLVAKGGVEQAAVDLVTASLVEALRKADVFSRVVAIRELEAAMGFEQVKQLADCSQSSCLAEIAGSLGVDLITSGEVGRLGGSYVVSCALIETRTARTVGAATERLPAASADVLLDAVPVITGRLLAALQGKRGGGTAMAPGNTAQPAGVSMAAPAPGPQVAVGPTTPEPPASSAWTWRALAVAGVAGALVTLPLTAVAVLVAYLCVGVVTRVYLLPVPYSGDVAGGVAALVPLALGLAVATAGWVVAALATWRSLS